jgi:predicted Zn finger-like uncharacterized protein
MIIECINCNKKFNVNSDLIPNEGRSIQCGSCNHIWFFDKNNQNETISSRPSKTINEKIEPIEKKPTQITEENQFISEDKNEVSINKDLEIIKSQNKSSFNFGKFLSYLIVLIITFISLLLIIDTFSSLLYDIFPSLESMLFNLYETLKDIKLFIKDLI